MKKVRIMLGSIALAVLMCSLTLGINALQGKRPKFQTITIPALEYARFPEYNESARIMFIVQDDLDFIDSDAVISMHLGGRRVFAFIVDRRDIGTLCVNCLGWGTDNFIDFREWDYREFGCPCRCFYVCYGSG